MLVSHDTDDDWNVSDLATLTDRMVDIVHIFQSPNGMWWWRRTASNNHPLCQSTRSYPDRRKALHHALRVNRKPFIVNCEGPRPEYADAHEPRIQPENAPWASTSA